MNSDHTLVAVFDSSHVRFFEYKPAQGRLENILADVSSVLHHDRRDIESDRPGRTISSGGQHHAFQSHSDPRKMEKHNFVHAIAQAVEAALDQHKFNALVVVAPERSVGEFRNVASKNVKEAIWREVPKEFTNLSDSELHDHLVPILQNPSK